jgi:hypothetical protein
MVKCGLNFFQEESYGNLIKMESLPFVKTEGKRDTFERAVQMSGNTLKEKCLNNFRFDQYNVYYVKSLYDVNHVRISR